MALGELVYEHTGRVTGQRVLNVKEEEQRPKIETSFSARASSKELMLQKRQHIGVFLDLVVYFMVRHKE
jgi:hypothetical protein